MAKIVLQFRATGYVDCNGQEDPQWKEESDRYEVEYLRLCGHEVEVKDYHASEDKIWCDDVDADGNKVLSDKDLDRLMNEAIVYAGAKSSGDEFVE